MMRFDGGSGEIQGRAGLRAAPLVLFTVLAVAVYVCSRGVLASSAFAVEPGVLSVALAFDLIVVVPAAYYLLMVRWAGRPAVSVLPVFVVATLVASALLADHAPFATHLWILGLPAEAALLGLVGWKVHRLIRAYGSRPRALRSFPEAFPHAVEEALGRSLPARIFAQELVVLWFALASWWHKPTLAPGTEAFWSHRKTAWPAIFVALLLVMATEIAVVHLLVSLWSSPVAWVLTGLGLYGALWLVADLQALRLRPTLLSGADLHLRIGLRWEADVPLRCIRAVRLHDGGSLPEGTVAFTVVGDPGWVLELDRPVEVRGPMGIRRSAQVLAFQVDDPRLAEALAPTP